ncbi:hypothetical protein ACQPXB_40255 [Amycolatopsis sp. CA-161197]|uniref:hypothetical protein n=1 Tax=unclassified Amycolatopsis TaxID=2618356 RepID=UPI003452E3C3
MPVPTKVRDRCLPFLPDGDRIQYVFAGNSLYLNGMAALYGFLVVVTDRRVVVLACGRFRRLRPKAVWEVLPRSTELGPVEEHPSLGPTISFADLVLEIDEADIVAIRAADLERDGAWAPQDPLPDL